jgi:hypothetical protein
LSAGMKNIQTALTLSESDPLSLLNVLTTKR